MKYTLCVPCLLGLESLIADELKFMGMENVHSINGRVYFEGGPREIIKANLRLRCGERILIEVGTFHAETFDELFEGTKDLPWEQLIPVDGVFPVTGHSLNSTLFSTRDCQAIIKKAIVERMKLAHPGIDWFSETGPKFAVQFSIMKDEVSLCVDTTGDGLHKRGYRPAHNAAPLKETMAASLVKLSRYRGRDEFCDPFCGSGTIAIEAALIARNIAPGLNRSFTCMGWRGFGKELWDEEKAAARAAEFNGSYRIYASDIDPEAVKIAKENAQRAGVADIIEFSVADAMQFDRRTEGGVIVTNPPYGERIMEKQEAEALYAGFGKALMALEPITREDAKYPPRGIGGWQLYLLSSHTEFERTFGRTADKKRKLYNGMIKCDLFMYNK